MIAQKSPRRYGHVILFEVLSDVIEVVYFFHTSQDWHNKAKELR